ncbi:MAG: hypothetical protein ACPLRN_02155 [Microgenomates group bacterium]
MDNLSNTLNELLSGLTKILLDARISEEVDREETQEIAQFILDQKRQITSIDQIDNFLEKLRIEYPIFRDYIDNFKKQKSAQDKDQEKIEAIKSQLLKFS